MEVIRISAQEYGNVFTGPYHVFNSVAFSELNKSKCEDLHYLVFKEPKIKLGIILGEKGNTLCSPFSAPFGGFSFNRSVEIEYYEHAVDILRQYSGKMERKVRITLPPNIYNSSHISKMFSALMRNDARLLYSDMNYQYPLDKFDRFEDCLERSARKNFHNSQRLGFDFQQLDSADESQVERAYEVIRINREARGYPLRMTLQAVLDTIKIVPADFFVMSYEGVDVAAAQVFHVTSDVCQVIYWGDVPEYSHLRVMNYFTYKVFEHYFNQGLKILDIGPSTEKGIPNYGLCSFKESIGCEVSLKHTFEL